MGNVESGSSWDVSISSPLNAPGSNVSARLLLRLNGSETWLRAVTVFPAVVTLKDLSGDEELVVGWSANLNDLGAVVVPASVVANVGAGKVWLGWTAGKETPWSAALTLARSLRTPKFRSRLRRRR